MSVDRVERVSLGRMPREEIAVRDASRLRQLLVARYGFELGVDAWHEAMAYAWEHRQDVVAMDNPLGYLYRVGHTAVRRQLRIATDRSSSIEKRDK